MLQWIDQTRTATTLVAIAEGTCPLTHEGIEQWLSPQASRHFRAILTTSGILEHRDELLANLYKWIDKTLDGVDNPEQRQLLRRFVTWHHLNRLRRQLGTDKYAEETQVTAVRASVRAALGLLRWLDARKVTLATCSQSDIDEWLISGSSTRYQARGFVQWSVQRKYADKIEIPEYRSASTTVPLSSEQRWKLARQLLNDSTINPGDRIAGLFTLLYAQSTARVARLKVSDITITADAALINFGVKPLQLPDEVAAILKEHIDNRRSWSRVGRDIESPWLFPGADCARHISPAVLGKRLNAIGFGTRPGRHAALRDLSTKVPAAVLADLLGISSTAADRWVDHAGASWAGYAAAVQRRRAP